jgi:predicted MPP superfamily phosphohydrolase
MRARDWLFHALTRPPYRDAAGHKGWLEPFTRAPDHVVRRLDLAIPGWPMRPLRIAFLSDFHTGSHAGDVKRLAAIVAEAAHHAPDLVLLGGDFVNMIPFGGGRVPPQVTAAILARLPAPLGRFAVLGNHDRNYGEHAVAEALRAHAITVLSDQRASLRFDGAEIDLVGIHDARRDRPAARALLAGLTPDRPALVLAHDPYWFRHLPAGPHLMLAGHTHGGQIRLAGRAWRNASWAPLRWSHGLVREHGSQMYVTSGLGSSGIPLRLGMPPEWVIVEVRGA